MQSAYLTWPAFIQRRRLAADREVVPTAASRAGWPIICFFALVKADPDEGKR
jgi:hypothetical protein